MKKVWWSLSILIVLALIVLFLIYYFIISTSLALRECSIRNYYGDEYSCIIEKAKIDNEISYCKRIKIKEIQWKCKQNLLMDPSICADYYSHSDRQYCYQYAAYYLDDVSICNSEHNCVEYLARNKLDVSICNEIKEEFRYNTCHDRIKLRIAHNTNDTSICFELLGALRTKDCLSEFAGKLGDPDLCKKMDDQNGITKDYCYKSVAIKLKDLEICKMINNSKSEYNERIKAECIDDVYISMAIDNMDEGICNNVSDPERNSACTDSVFRLKAIEFNDLSYCERTSSEQWKEACIYSVAVELMDESICENISDETIERYCYENIRNKN